VKHPSNVLIFLDSSPSRVQIRDLPHGRGPLSQVNDGVLRAHAPNSAPNASEQRRIVVHCEAAETQENPAVTHGGEPGRKPFEEFDSPPSPPAWAWKIQA